MVRFEYQAQLVIGQSVLFSMVETWCGYLYLWKIPWVFPPRPVYFLGFLLCRSGLFAMVKDPSVVRFGHVRSSASVCWDPGVLPMVVSADLLLG